VTATDAAIFVPDGHRFVPQDIAVGPWDANALHGGAPTALLGRVVLGHEPGDVPWFLARLTVELIRPVPKAPLEVRAEIRRPGKRVQVLDAALVDEHGTEVAWARGVRLAQAPNGLDEASVLRRALPELPGPEASELFEMESMIPWRTFIEAFEMRLAVGAPFRQLGPSAIWSRLRVPLLPGEAVDPLTRALAIADFPNGAGNNVPFEQFSYINPDLTVSLHRLPESEWVLLDAAMHPRSTGHGTAVGELRDLAGHLGTSIQSLLLLAR